VYEDGLVHTLRVNYEPLAKTNTATNQAANQAANQVRPAEIYRLCDHVADGNGLQTKLSYGMQVFVDDPEVQCTVITCYT
jgi:hypothetical protein